MFANQTLIAGLLSLALAVPAMAVDAPQSNNGKTEQQAQKSPSERRAIIRENTRRTLEELYAAHPEAKAGIEKAAGYAVFRTGGVQFVFAGAGGGEGEAIRHGKETFMSMAQIKAGLGLGAKESRLVLVFMSEKAYNKFVTSGWAFSGDATAAAKLGDSGAGLSGAALIAPEIYAYQFTENGLTAEVTVAGTKYFKEKRLNGAD
ncbi:Lipid-binding SYLF domain-containing protein [Andreprevotia lacus DSM 23236]|jgi:lipid-binding SYLF domain-containing protein|uniref:Lipid-binding SYLF domain-containing protein n=1 Tax=Andreprevotia lacus DSM 23236 TaxID=1121001 RepID=A0A1W1XRI6_9NEIS|nr:YSC84-related protein [Andreprevotia lacus]SMC26465.1 Lipid-binding SYLF domain-containing protein [Andreprevotia lacus DSM 23236]